MLCLVLGRGRHGDVEELHRVILRERLDTILDGGTSLVSRFSYSGANVARSAPKVCSTSAGMTAWPLRNFTPGSPQQGASESLAIPRPGPT